MAIQLVGYNSGSSGGSLSNLSVSLGSLSGGLATSPSQGDIVILFASFTGTSPTVSTLISSGYTTLASLTGDDSRDSGLLVAYKIMGGTPDTEVIVGPPETVDNGQVAIVRVYRGVDSNTPLDVTTSTATGSNNGRPDPPSILPTTSGALIVVGGSGSAIGNRINFSSSDLSNVFSDQDNRSSDALLGTGDHSWTSGTFDPTQFGNGSTGNGESWAAATLALRPSSIVSYGIYLGAELDIENKVLGPTAFSSKYLGIT